MGTKTPLQCKNHHHRFGEKRIHQRIESYREKCPDFLDNYNEVAEKLIEQAKENEEIFKDLDILEDQTMISIGSIKKNELLKQIKDDCEFLEGFNIMDYSLLIGIQEKNPETK